MARGRRSAADGWYPPTAGWRLIIDRFPPRRTGVSAWAVVTAALALAVFFVGGVGDPAGRLRVFWLANLTLDGLMVCFSVALTRAVPKGPPFAFWLAMSIAMGTFALGDTGSALAGFGYLHPPGGISTVQSSALSVGYLTVLVTLLRHPLRWSSRGARLAFWLDNGTVSVAAAGLGWYLSVHPHAAWSYISLALVTAAAFALTTFAGARLAVSDNPPVARPAATLLIASVATMFAVSILVPMPDLATAEPYRLRMLVSLLPGAFGVAGMVAQRRILAVYGTPDQPRVRRRRPYSRLPYAAVAVTFTLLLASFPGVAGGTDSVSNVRTTGMLFAVMVCVAMVIARQLLAFADNDRLLARLRRQEGRHSALLRHSSDITTIVDAQLRFTFVSPAVHRILGYQPADLLDTGPRPLVHPDDLHQVTGMLRDLLAAPGGTGTVQARFRHADGSWRWLEVISTNMIDAPHVGGVISNSRDVTTARELRDLLQLQASRDPLTHLANRATFAERLAAALDEPPGDGETRPRVTVMLIDLDDFKMINDTYGHHAGDDALVALADRLRGCLRRSDLAARLGGDEFGAILPGATVGEATLTAERILSALRRPIPVDGRAVQLSVSIGIAGSSGMDPDELMRAADTAMYQAKQVGKARYAVYDPAPTRTAPARRPG